MHLNEVILLGTLARDPERRQTDRGADMVTATVCIEEPGDERSFRTYVPLTAYSRAANVLRTLSEGDMVLAKGKVSYRSWQGQDGKKTGRMEVTAWHIQAVPLATPAAVAQN